MRWESLQGETKPFFDFCEEACVPGTHIRMPRHSWHSTLYAVAEVRKFQPPCESLRQSAREILDQFIQNGIEEHLTKLPRLEITPKFLKHFENGSTIEFEAAGALSNLRSAVAAAVETTAPRLIGETASIFGPKGAKNEGRALWGSIARNPDASAESVLHQKIPLLPPIQVPLEAIEAILTISNPSFTNSLEEGDSFKVLLKP